MHCLYIQDQALMLVKPYLYGPNKVPYGLTIDMNRDTEPRPSINQHYRRSIALTPESIDSKILYEGQTYLLTLVTVKEVDPDVSAPLNCPKLKVVLVEGYAAKHSTKSRAAATKFVWKDGLFILDGKARTDHPDAKWIWSNRNRITLTAPEFQRMCKTFPPWESHSDPACDHNYRISSASKRPKPTRKSDSSTETDAQESEDEEEDGDDRDEEEDGDNSDGSTLDLTTPAPDQVDEYEQLRNLAARV